ncbi:hypothetical protein [Elongatibacter sediminis]|uniref:Uncharacterized protein n=1 Tax=Elongatibacter sediminis TaxID=3119006 RepID=A0AAW9RAV5_9GAMM
MRYDDYAGAIEHRWLEYRLQRCSEQDYDQPADAGTCARKTVRDCVCPCIASEENICNALSASITESMLGTGFCR